MMSEDIQRLIENFQRAAKGRPDQVSNVNAAIDSVDKALAKSVVCPFHFSALHYDNEGNTQESTFYWDGSHVCHSRGDTYPSEEVALKQLSLYDRIAYYPALAEAVKMATNHVSKQAPMFAGVTPTPEPFDYGPPPSDDDVPF